MILNEDEILDLKEKLNKLQEKFIFDNLIYDDLTNAIENKNYDKIEDLLLKRKITTNQFLGTQNNQNIEEIIYTKYTTIDTLLFLLESKENLLKLIDDNKLKNMFNNFLIEFFSIKFAKYKYIELINNQNLVEIKKSIRNFV